MIILWYHESWLLGITLIVDTTLLPMIKPTCIPKYIAIWLLPYPDLLVYLLYIQLTFVQHNQQILITEPTQIIRIEPFISLSTIRWLIIICLYHIRRWFHNLTQVVLLWSRRHIEVLFHVLVVVMAVLHL